MADATPKASKEPSLGKSARASLLWGGGFTLFRDVAQFAAMLVLVRLLSPADYGTAALAQSIVNFLSVVSFGRLVAHALQLRDPAQIDWQAHFTAATAINLAMFVVTLVVAWLLSLAPRYEAAAAPVAFLSVAFLIEIPGSLRHYMLQAEHDWPRFRVLLVIGTLLALAVGFAVAWAGGGVWALVIQPPLLGLPAAYDLFVNAKWRPDWSWSWERYRATARFGMSRMAVAAASTGRALAEQAIMVAAFDFAVVGFFTRAIGLATLAAGRIGVIASSALYPVITRAEKGSAQFRRNAATVLGGVTWSTLGAAAVLVVTAPDIVRLLYGPQWDEVAPLLPLAAGAVAASGIYAAAASLLLANNAVRRSVLLDTLGAALGIVLALVLVPFGAMVYLMGLIAHGALMCALTLVMLIATGGIERSSLVGVFVPAALGMLAAVGAIVAARHFLGSSPHFIVRLVVDSFVVGVVYLGTLRFVFPTQLAALVAVVPGGARIGRALRLA